MSHFAYLRLLAKVLPNIISPYGTISGFTFYIITFILATALSGATIWLFNHKYLKNINRKILELDENSIIESSIRQ